MSNRAKRFGRNFFHHIFRRYREPLVDVVVVFVDLAGGGIFTTLLDVRAIWNVGQEGLFDGEAREHGV